MWRRIKNLWYLSGLEIPKHVIHKTAAVGSSFQNTLNIINKRKEATVVQDEPADLFPEIEPENI